MAVGIFFDLVLLCKSNIDFADGDLSLFRGHLANISDLSFVYQLVSDLAELLDEAKF